MKKRILAFVLALMMGISLVGCGGGDTAQDSAPADTGSSSSAPADSSSSEPEKKDGFVIGFSNEQLGANVWMMQCEAEVRQVLEEFKADGTISEYYMTNADGDLVKQIADIRDLIAKGVDAICVNPNSPEGLNGVLQEAYDAGIVVMTWGNQCTFENQLGWVGTDDSMEGKMMGEFLGNAIPEGGKVLEIAGFAGLDTCEVRKAAAEEAFYAANPTAEILAVEYCDWDYAKAKVALESMLVTYPEFDGILTLHGFYAMAAIDVLTEHGMDIVPVSGESNNGFLKMWKELDETLPGGYPNIGFISPSRQGALATELLVEYLQTGVKPEELTQNERGVYYDNIEPITLETLDDFVRYDLIDGYFCGGDRLYEETRVEMFGIEQ